tara:strand:- start:281 stop:508 length:228 start_codon:yes stop_codon:yes gene_type:complete
MENYQEKEADERFTVEKGSTEEGFLQGFESEEDPEECAECGKALRGKPIIREVENEQLKFCSEDCAEDYEDSITK